MTNGILDFQHTSGPAPAYAIESDSEEDEWADEPIQAAGIKPKKPEEATQDRKLEWHPSPPHDRSPVELMIFIGDIGLLIGSGLPEQLRSEFFQLDQYILLAKSAPFLLSPRFIPLQLQSTLARKLLRYQGIYHYCFLVSSSYLYPFLKRLSAYTLSRLVPNLIKGFEAALMIQANILKIESKMILLPSIGVPHDEKSTTSIPIGQYDFTSSIRADRPACSARPSHTLADHLNAYGPTNLVTLYRDKLKLDRDRKSIPTSSDALTHHHDSSGLMYM
ncbi:hypothetical protein H4Q26_014673 [Puccinia striiformis f. sp. tritici PST-130]|nr:hypothetical protein H4Q26_014673 [Puccinia striiformis f. sp. tritici PST-130]